MFNSAINDKELRGEERSTVTLVLTASVKTCDGEG